MARIRSIKPEFWTDRKMAKDLTRDERLFYIALWNEVDDQGRFIAEARRLLGVLFPYDDDLTDRDIEVWTVRLAETGRIVLYEVDGQRYGVLPKFKDHQKISKPTKSRLPDPPGFPWESQGNPGEPRQAQESPPTDIGSRILDLGSEDLGGRITREALPPPDEPDGDLWTWMGGHARVLDDFDRMGKAAGVNHGPVWEMGLWGLYRPPGYHGEQDGGGTATKDFGKEPVKDWPEILAQALTEAGAKGQAFSPKFIRGCVRQVVRSREGDRKRSKSVPYMTKAQEDEREAERKSSGRTNSGPSQISDIGVLLKKSEAETRKLNDEAERRAKWFDGLPDAEKARIKARAESSARKGLEPLAPDAVPPDPSPTMVRISLMTEINEAWKASQEQGAA